MAVLVADSLPLDQYYVQHPDELHKAKGDDLLIDLDSRVILEAHLQCAAYEMPVSHEDSVYFGPRLKKLCDVCLERDKEGWSVQAAEYHYVKLLPHAESQVPHEPEVPSLSKQACFHPRNKGTDVFYH